MLLTKGARLGPYEILAPIGAGGMGEVYRARDTKLGRDVAIKVLPETFAAEADRLARFEREAWVLASLNHPNIAHLYGLEDAGAAHALVMELVEGPTLADRIAAGPLDLADALPVARQIAEALEAAHEQGIIHRDLKPANVKVRDDGTVKVLDFGLAKAFDPSAGSNVQAMDSPTMTARATQMGVLIGTAAYMAPEQAKGRAADKRADVWAFGVVLYEMLSGVRAFEGEDISDTLAAVLRQEITLAGLPAATPVRLRRLIERCLERDPKQRLRDIGEARIELTRIEAGGADMLGALPETAAATHGRPREKVYMALLFVAALALLALAAPAIRSLRHPAEPVEGRFQVPAPAAPNPYNLTVSPDGRWIAYVVGNSAEAATLYVRPINSLSARQMGDTDGAQGLFWSPDSRFIAFFARGKLRKVEIANGGQPQDVCRAPFTSGVSGTWNSLGDIIFGSGAGLQRVSASGGTPTALTEVDSSHEEFAHLMPSFLPDGRHYLYLAFTPDPSDRVLYAGSFGSKERKRIMSTDSLPVVYVSAGYLVYHRQGGLFAQPFDAGKLQLTGEPVRIADGIAYSSQTGRAAFAVSLSGVLIYRTGEGGPATNQFVWFDRSGKELGRVGEPDVYGPGFGLSPDGRQIAATKIDLAGNKDIWMIEWERGAASRFTLSPSRKSDVVWSPDGLRIAFSAIGQGAVGSDIFEKKLSGAGDESPLAVSPLFKFVEDWSRDGRYVVYVNQKELSSTSHDLWVLPLFGDRKPFPIVQSAFAKDEPHFSFDGHWLAYNSFESGTWQVYVISFPAGDGKRQISTKGGAAPRWRSDGRELYYLALDGKLMAVDMKTDAGLEPGSPQVLFDTGLTVAGNYDLYDATADGKRFLFLKPASAAPAPITVVLNWPALLKEGKK